ncbi:MAG: valine--tRNA ligase, partial [Candidatus Omnitrophota bacterium]
AVNEVFVRLYEKDLVYRGDYIINWCPRCQTALADEEAPHHELDGKLYYIKYPLKEPQAASGKPQAKKSKTIDYRLSAIDHLVVATTRPETMLGDTAVAVHPTDKRYKKLIGKTIILPLMERKIKIIADKAVDKKFGTGAVKVTPAHDPNDYTMGKEHNLEFINIMHPDGVLNANAGDYAGMDRFEARQAIIEDLKERKLLLKIEEHKHAVGHCYRCHTIVEPYLSKQWFVRMKPLAKPAIAAVKKGEIKFTPKRWTKVYLNWMDNIRDWCISRQIWWGHRLPVYYCQKCSEVNVARVRPEKCRACGSLDLKQDEDVLDTWFSSWLWPFATLGWPFAEDQSIVHSPQTTEKSKSVDRGLSTVDQMRNELDYFYPTSVLVTAPEIIFFWVARMIMAGCEFTNEIPFRDVYIHGTVRDVEGRKMSKSLGNSIDPLEVIDQFGADALRFSLMASAASGSDIYLSQERFEQGRNFCNKIWNASRFILMNLKEGVIGERINWELLDVQNKWILTELNATIQKVTKSIDAFKFNEAINTIYEFFWHKFCDWYIEIAKASIGEQNTQEVLVHVFKKTLLLLSPFMPFIADEISSKLPGEKLETIAVAAWPKSEKSFDDKAAVQTMKLIFEIVFTVRNLRAELNLSSQTKVRVRISTGKQMKKLLEDMTGLIGNLAYLEQLEITSDASIPRNSLSALVSQDVHVNLLLEGLVDAEKEKLRLDDQIQQAHRQLIQKEKMLKNKDFVKKAPAAVVDKEKQKCVQLKEVIERLKKVRNAFQ